MQWLGVPRRQTTWRHGPGLREEDLGDLGGLVLLDLPDHDSTAVEHQHEVDRLVELVDLLVWVVDPQKYADELLHERYLRRLAGHEAVTVVVLNQVDTMNPFAAAECADDLRRLLDDDGLRRAPVLTGLGAHRRRGRGRCAPCLPTRWPSVVPRNDRLVADVEEVVESLAPVGVDRRADRRRRRRARPAGRGVGDVRGRARDRCRDRGVLAAARRRAARLAADPVARSGCAPTRCAGCTSRVTTEGGALGAGPLVGARADPGAACAGRHGGAPVLRRRDAPTFRRRGSVPFVPRRCGRSADVRDRLDQAVVGTDLGVDRTPLWWRAGAALQWLLTAAAVVGGVWLLALAFGSYLRLPDPPTPDVGGVAVPTLLLVGGVLVGLLLAALGRLMVRGGR